MIEQLDTIVILILSVLYVWTRLLIHKKNKIVKEDGIEKISRDIERLEYEKVNEQKRIVRERSDILYTEFLTVFCKNMDVTTLSKEAAYYKALILDQVRKETDSMMNVVVYINNIAGREGTQWTNYKKEKFDYILATIIQYISQIYRKDLIGFEYDHVIQKCRADIIRVYMSHIDPMFEEIKTISVEYKKKIKEQERILAMLKNGKPKRKNNEQYK
jgi:hypothetical protein